MQVSGLLIQASQAISAVWLARVLGAAGQGLFVSALSLQALFYFLVSVGVWPATTSQIAAANLRGQNEKLATWLAFMAKSMLVFGVGLTVAGWFLLPVVSRALYGAQNSEAAFIGLWAWLLNFQIILEMPRSVVGVALHGTRRMFALSKVENGHELLRLTMVVGGAWATRSPAGAVLGSLGSSTIASCVALIIYRRERRGGFGWLPSMGEIAMRMPGVPIWRGLRMGLRVGLVMNISLLALNTLPRLAIGTVANIEWVAYFHIAQRILEVPLKLMLGISRTVLPALSEFAGLRDFVRFRRLFWRATVVSGCLVAAGTLGAMPLVKSFVGAFFSEDFVDPVWRNYRALAFGYIPFGFGAGIEAFYLATNRIKWWVGLTLFGVSYSIPIHLWLIIHVPFTGTAAGMVCYHSFVLAHLTYIALWFRSADQESAWGTPSAAHDG